MGDTIVTEDARNALVYDFGEHISISAVLIKTDQRGLGTQSIKVSVPQWDCNDRRYGQSEHLEIGQDDWTTHCRLAVKSYNGWLGYTNLGILSRVINLTFDSHGAVILELLFV